MRLNLSKSICCHVAHAYAEFDGQFGRTDGPAMTRGALTTIYLLLSLASVSGSANESDWIGPPGVARPWHSATNWSDGVPGTGTVATIGNSGIASVDSGDSASRVLVIGSGPGLTSGTGTVVCIGQTVSNLVTFVGYGKDGSSSVGGLFLTNGTLTASLLSVGRSLDGGDVLGTARISNSDVTLRTLGVGEVIDHANAFSVGSTTGTLTIASPSHRVTALETNGFEVYSGTVSGAASTNLAGQGTLVLQANEIVGLSVTYSGLASTFGTNAHVSAEGLVRLTSPTIRAPAKSSSPFWYIGVASAHGPDSSASALGTIELHADLVEPVGDLYIGVCWASNLNARSTASGIALLDIGVGTFETVDLGVHYGGDLTASSQSLASGVLTVTDRSHITIEKDLRAGLVLPKGEPSTGQATATLHVAGVLNVNGLLHLGQGSTSRVVIASSDVPRIQAASAEVDGGVLEIEFALPSGPEPGVLYPAISISSSNGLVGSFSSVEVTGGPDTMASGIGRNQAGETVIWAGIPSTPWITEINVSETGVVLQVSGVVSGMSYEVEDALDLRSNSWHSLDAPIPSGNSDTWMYSPDNVHTSAVYRALYRAFD